MCDLDNYFHGRHNYLHLKSMPDMVFVLSRTRGSALVISEGIVEFHCCDEYPPLPPALRASPLISLNGEAQRASVGSRSLGRLNVEFVYFV